MSSTSYERPLRLNPQVSFLLLAIIAAIHIAAVVVVFILPMPILLKALFAPLIILAGVYVLRRRVLFLDRQSIKNIVHHMHGDWYLELRDGQQYRAELRNDTFVSRWLIVLNFRADNGKSYSLPIIPGVLDQESCRQLRVRLLLDRQA